MGTIIDKLLGGFFITPHPKLRCNETNNMNIVSQMLLAETSGIELEGKKFGVRVLGKNEIKNRYKLKGEVIFRKKTLKSFISSHMKGTYLIMIANHALTVKDGEVYDAFKDKELRYRNRHLDLIVNDETRETFIKRTKIVNEIRNTLNSKQFLEVETPVLQPIYGGANARPFTTHHNALDQKLFLRIADELYLKRLIIGGFEKVYEMSKDFRNEGMDRNHNPEFTMLEFYWAYADYQDCMDLVEELIRNAAKTIGGLKIKWGEFEIDLSQKFEKKSFYKLLEEATGSDLSKITKDEMLELCDVNSIKIDKNSNIGQILDTLMSNLVEPKLINPTFVIDYPKSISPLAKLKRDGSKDIVERFELFIGGSEFANSFSELNDPLDQRSRLEEQSKLKDQGDEEAQPIDEEFIKAMEIGMPPTGGVGIGIDRLVMLLTNNRWIRDVILFPTMKSEKE